VNTGMKLEIKRLFGDCAIPKSSLVYPPYHIRNGDHSAAEATGVSSNSLTALRQNSETLPRLCKAGSPGLADISFAPVRDLNQGQHLLHLEDVLQKSRFGHHCGVGGTHHSARAELSPGASAAAKAAC
jgi:hypothetical protein